MKVCGWDKAEVPTIVGTASICDWTRDGKATSSRSFREPDPDRGQLMIPIRVRFDPPQVGEPDQTMQPRKEPQMRRMKITESMLQKYGYTGGCEGCRAKAAGMTQKPHGEACRKRREQALDGDEAGRELRHKNTELKTHCLKRLMTVDSKT